MTSRESLLSAARVVFAEAGYDRASVRVIARQAGVDPSLVYHFFGSKDGLLRAAMQLPIDPQWLFEVMNEHPGDEGRALVRRALEIWRIPEFRDHMTGLIRTAISHEAARGALRGVLADALASHLQRRIGTADARLRAGLVASQMAGLSMARFVIGIDAIVEAGDDELVDAIGPTVQRYLFGNLAPPPY